MTNSSAWPRPRAIRRVTAFQRWTERVSRVVYTPAILIKDIREFPEVISLLKEKVAENKVVPQLHGYEHIDYAKLSEQEIDVHLDSSFHWFSKVLGTRPTIWSTPWGAKNETMIEAAKKYDLTVEGTDDTVDVKKALSFLRKGNPVNTFEGATILEHWWHRGSTLLRFLECVKHGSFDNAILWDQQNREDRIF